MTRVPGQTGTRAHIPVAEPALGGNEARYVADCLETGWVSSIGPYISRFEEAFASFCGTRAAVACNTGTAAIHLALLALGVRPGDEVLVPTLTYVAAANAVRYCGAEPVFVESDPRTMTLDPDDLVARITPRSVGVIAVHLYGQPADMIAVNNVASRAGLWVVEDAAEAHGARVHGRAVGSLGSLGAFSFFGNKIVTTGEGGMVTVNDPLLESRVRLLRGQGQDPQRRYWFPVVGHNYRMTNIEAAIGFAQMEQVGDQLRRRSLVGEWYRASLAPVADLVELPPSRPGVAAVNWLFTIVLRDECPRERDELIALLATDGIETRPVFTPMHALPPYARPGAAFPVAERLARRGLNLPTSARLTEDEVAFVASRIAWQLGRRR